MNNRRRVLLDWWGNGGGEYDLHIQIGDSLARGNSDGEGPTPTSGTVFEWNGSAIVEVTTDDLLPAVTGSPWPKHGALRYAATGRKQLYANCAVGGSEIGPYGDRWDVTGVGTLWDNAVDKVAGALLLSINSISVYISGGVNDYRGGTKPTSAEFKTAYQTIINRVLSTWNPGSIFLFEVGQSDSESLLACQYRNVVRELENENTKVYRGLSNLSAYAQGYMQPDRVHWTQDGNNQAAVQIDRHQRKSSLSKIKRNLLSRFDTELSTAHENAWLSFIDSCEANGNLTSLEYLVMLTSSTDKNRKIELLRSGIPQPDSATHSANSHVSTNGTSTFIGAGYIPSTDRINATQDDVIVGVKVKTITTAGTTTAGVFGTQAGAQFYLLQGSAGMQYRVNDGTATTYGAKQKPSDNTWIAIGRNGTTKFLMEDAVQLSSAVVASVSTPGRPMSVGARNLNFGSNDLFCAGEFECFFAARWTTLTSYANLLSDLNTLITALKA